MSLTCPIEFVYNDVKIGILPRITIFAWVPLKDPVGLCKRVSFQYHFNQVGRIVYLHKIESLPEG